MNYGLQISASGVLTNLHRLDVFGNNLANLNTPGFKADSPAIRQRDPARIEDGVMHLPSNRLLEELGAGAQLGQTRVSFLPGPLAQTGQDFDLAITGDGFFRVGVTENGVAGERYTRNGRLTRNAQGMLVTATEGLAVLDDNGRPISVGTDGRIQVNADGVVSQNGQSLGRIGLVDFADRDALIKRGDSLFEAGPDAGRRPADGRIVQGSIERSGVSEIGALLAVQGASRAVQSNMGMIATHDRLMEQAISRLGRLALQMTDGGVASTERT